jgi:hypothetical protein
MPYSLQTGEEPMKTNGAFLSQSLRFLFAAVVVRLSLAVGAQPSLPFIESIALEQTNVMVSARVPAGQARVVLESRECLGRGAWVPCAVHRVARGENGTITFRLPRSEQTALLRVRATDTEPLPAAFYLGTNLVSGEPLEQSGAYSGLAVFDSGAADAGTLAITANPAPSSASEAARTVVESDIWRIQGATLYYFNSLRGLQVIDISSPDSARVLGALNLPASGEQMYLLGSNQVILLARGRCPSGDGSQVVLVAVDGGVPSVVTNLVVSGQFTESRLVGTALYVASQEYRPVPGTTNSTWEWGTHVESFDLARLAAPVTRSRLWFAGANNVVAATDRCLFVAVADPSQPTQSLLHVIDISAPDGTMSDYESIRAAGTVPDKFKVNYAGDVLAVISEVVSPTLHTELETFRLPDPRSVTPVRPFKLGEVELGQGERLYATRFDGTRAYAVTFRQIDPLWVVDLNDPAQPTVSGELQVPGWSTYIHPLGDRLVAVGTESGRVSVSLFDVADAKRPSLLSRVRLGDGWSYSEANQDEKAFTVLPDAGLILVPVTGNLSNNCVSWVQLIDLGQTNLTARGYVEQPFAPRRATLHGDRVLSLSANQLVSVDATDRDHPQVRGRLELAWSVSRVLVKGGYLLEVATGADGASSDLRVVSTGDANRVLKALPLGAIPVAGAALRGDRLYLAQAAQVGPAPIYTLNADGTRSLAPTNPPSFWLTVLSVSNLPNLEIVGQAAVGTAPLGWNVELEALWPQSNLLVWVGRGQSYSYGGWGDVIPMVLGQPMSLFGRVPWYWPWCRGGTARLLAFDVREGTAPTFVSEVDLSTNGGWSFSQPFLAQGRVYLSHQNQVYFPDVKPLYYGYGLVLAGTPASDGGIIAVDEPTNGVVAGVWGQGHFLDVVDYADAPAPAVRAPVGLPGALQGLSHDGEMLYTVGAHLTPSNFWAYPRPQYLDASAYDGVGVHLVDSRPLSSAGPSPLVVAGTNLFLGQIGPTTSASLLATNTLETWTVSAAGRLTQIGTVALPASAGELRLFPGLLSAKLTTGRLHLFDPSDAAALRLVGDGPNSCLPVDAALRQADGAAARGL